MKDLIIVGGGITGLASAYIAAKSGLKVTVLEASPKAGGLLNTFDIAGTKLEYFYHHFFTHDAELHWLFKELGIEQKVIYTKSTMGVYTHGTLFNLNKPTDLFTIPYISLVDKLKFGLSSIYLARFADWKNMEGIRAIDWLTRYSGSTTTDTLWQPLLKVKFGQHAREVPIAWMVGRLSQRLRSRKSGSEMLGYLEGSLDTLLQAILIKLEAMGVRIITNAQVDQVNIYRNKISSLNVGKKIYKSSKYLFTTQSYILGRLLKASHPEYSQKLLAIKYFGAVCTILETKDKLTDTYWTNVADTGLPFGGIIEHTNLVRPTYYQNKHITYLSRYFTADEPLAKMTDDQIKKVMLGGIIKIFPKLLVKKPLKVYVFKTNSAAVVCPLNFSLDIPKCQTPISNLYIATMAHIYPDERSCNNSIRVAAEACRIMNIDSTFVPKGTSLSGQIGM